MCYVCNCFSWTLDLIQRALTFILSCWLVFAVCCGLFIAVIAGVAYGYNYCLAEFITFSKTDVRVYLRRGQFEDRPDLLHARRKSGDEDDLFPYNLSDYNQQVPLSDDSLSGKWKKDQDTRKYVAVLDKYSEEKSVMDADQQADLPESPGYYKLTTPPSRRASYVPNRYISTTILQSGSSQIVLRQFEPMPEVNFNENESYEYIAKTLQDVFASEATEDDEDNMRVITLPPDVRIRVEDTDKGYKSVNLAIDRFHDFPKFKPFVIIYRNTIKMRHWRTTAKPIIMDYSPDVEEEAVVYRAV